MQRLRDGAGVAGWAAMQDDLRRAIRLLMQSPGFAAIAIATLAIGIAANTAIFSVVNGVLLKPLTFPNAERIVAVNTEWPDRGRQTQRVTGGDYVDLRAQADLLE